MKLRFVLMPHELERPGDACWFESSIESEWGNLWLYVWLPGEPIFAALRLRTWAYVAKSNIGPKVYTWDGDRKAPTIVEAMPCAKSVAIAAGHLV